MGDSMTDETVPVDQDKAVDNDTEQPESGAPADDEQETAVDAFIAEDEADAPAEGTTEPGQ
jgi:hypothetical protein